MLIYQFSWVSTRDDRFEGIMLERADHFLDKQRRVKVLDSYGGSFASFEGSPAVDDAAADNGYVLQIRNHERAEQLRDGLTAVVGYPVDMEPITGERAKLWRHSRLHYWLDRANRILRRRP